MTLSYDAVEITNTFVNGLQHGCISLGTHAQLLFNSVFLWIWCSCNRCN